MKSHEESNWTFFWCVILVLIFAAWLGSGCGDDDGRKPAQRAATQSEIDEAFRDSLECHEATSPPTTQYNVAFHDARPCREDGQECCAEICATLFGCDAEACNDQVTGTIHIAVASGDPLCVSMERKLQTAMAESVRCQQEACPVVPGQCFYPEGEFFTGECFG